MAVYIKHLPTDFSEYELFHILKNIPLSSFGSLEQKTPWEAVFYLIFYLKAEYSALDDVWFSFIHQALKTANKLLFICYSKVDLSHDRKWF